MLFVFVRAPDCVSLSVPLVTLVGNNRSGTDINNIAQYKEELQSPGRCVYKSAEENMTWLGSAMGHVWTVLAGCDSLYRAHMGCEYDWGCVGGSRSTLEGC